MSRWSNKQREDQKGVERGRGRAFHPGDRYREVDPWQRHTRRLIEVLRRLINGSLMKIITISIANRVDRPRGGGGGRETWGPWTNQPWSGGGWADWRDERTNESVQKRNASSSNPICARLGWAWRCAARSTPRQHGKSRIEGGGYGRWNEGRRAERRDSAG